MLLLTMVQLQSDKITEKKLKQNETNLIGQRSASFEHKVRRMCSVVSL